MILTGELIGAIVDRKSKCSAATWTSGPCQRGVCASNLPCVYERYLSSVCYRLFTRDWFDQSLLPFQPVEIQRIALEQVVLMIMAVIDGSVATVLENMPTPPPNARVSSALSTLKRVRRLNKFFLLKKIFFFFFFFWTDQFARCQAAANPSRSSCCLFPVGPQARKDPHLWSHPVLPQSCSDDCRGASLQVSFRCAV